MEDELSLTLQAIKYMIWFQIAGICFRLAAFVYNPALQAPNALIFPAITLGITYLFYIGLKAEKTWVAILFATLCLFDFCSAIADGFSMVNSLNLVDAVLSFVAICGIVIWFRERRPVGHYP